MLGVPNLKSEAKHYRLYYYSWASVNTVRLTLYVDSLSQSRDLGMSNSEGLEGLGKCEIHPVV